MIFNSNWINKKCYCLNIIPLWGIIYFLCILNSCIYICFFCDFLNWVLWFTFNCNVYLFFSLILYIILCHVCLTKILSLFAVCLWIWKWFMIQFIQSPLIWNATSVIYWFIYMLRSVYEHLKIIHQPVPLPLFYF